MEMLVVFNDTQLLRQCDQEAFGAFLQFVRNYRKKITHVVANGDITDYEEQSRFAKYPDTAGQALDEIAATKWVFKTLTDWCPNAERVMIDGNHDERWSNMIKDQSLGIEQWLKTPDEMFEYKRLGWGHIKYGMGQFYKWHERLFWHGHRAGAKSNIPKLEIEETGFSTTTAHINRNMYYEWVDALGRHRSGITHGGFSKNNLPFMKKANTGWGQGFGVYFYDKKFGEQTYSVIMKHGNPRFIWEGNTFDGKGFQIPI